MGHGSAASREHTSTASRRHHASVKGLCFEAQFPEPPAPSCCPEHNLRLPPHPPQAMLSWCPDTPHSKPNLCSSSGYSEKMLCLPCRQGPNSHWGIADKVINGTSPHTFSSGFNALGHSDSLSGFKCPQFFFHS